MKFDSNRAWLDAVAAVRANRETLLALGGVFFLLPTLLSTVFLTDLQTRILENVAKPELVNRLVGENIGLLAAFGLGGTLVQVIGYLAVMALLSGEGRPTVGQAISAGIRALPTLIGVGLLVFIATLLASLVLSLVVVGLLSLVGAGAIGSILAVVALLFLLAYASVKLSLVMPVVLKERIGNPLAALVRSWRLTRGNSPRLFGFFTMLTLAYMAIAMVATFVLVAPVMLIFGQGQAAVLAMGLVSGAVGAGASILLTAVMVQAYRQLAGPTTDEVAQPFQ